MRLLSFCFLLLLAIGCVTPKQPYLWEHRLQEFSVTPSRTGGTNPFFADGPWKQLLVFNPLAENVTVHVRCQSGPPKDWPYNPTWIVKIPPRSERAAIGQTMNTEDGVCYIKECLLDDGSSCLAPNS